MKIIQSLRGSTESPFSPCIVSSWWRKLPAIENCGKIYCVVPGGDLALAIDLCKLLNAGLQNNARWDGANWNFLTSVNF